MSDLDMVRGFRMEVVAIKIKVMLNKTQWQFLCRDAGRHIYKTLGDCGADMILVNDEESPVIYFNVPNTAVRDLCTEALHKMLAR